MIDAVAEPSGLTNITFEVDTTLFPSGPHTLQLWIADNSGAVDFEDGDIETVSAPISVQFANVIYGVDWTGVLERRFVAIFGTTVTDGQIHLVLTDDLNRTWLDETYDLADVRQPDGSIIIEDPIERLYTGVKTFEFGITVTPAAGAAPASIGSFFLTVNQRPENDFGYNLVVNQDNTSTAILGTFGSFSPNVQLLFDLSADNALFAGQTVMNTINLNSEIDPFSADRIFPRTDTQRNDFNRIRDSLNNVTGPTDHPNDITFFTYLGHGGFSFFGWGTGRPAPLNVQNVRASELKPIRLARANTNGVVNYAVIFGCRSIGPQSRIMKALIGTPTGLSYNHYGRLGLWPKFGLGFTNSGRVARAFLGEPYTPVFDFFSEWHVQTYIQRDGQGLPLYTFNGAFTRAANKNAAHLEGSEFFGMAGCTNCFLDEVVTGRLRVGLGAAPLSVFPSSQSNPAGLIRPSPSGQPVWQPQPDER